MLVILDADVMEGEMPSLDDLNAMDYDELHQTITEWVEAGICYILGGNHTKTALDTIHAVEPDDMRWTEYPAIFYLGLDIPVNAPFYFK